MKKTNVEENVLEIKFINENIYQQYKKKMCKSDDYVSVKEWNNILKRRNE